MLQKTADMHTDMDMENGFFFKKRLYIKFNDPASKLNTLRYV